jgi:hypothetical protein
MVYNFSTYFIQGFSKSEKQTRPNIGDIFCATDAVNSAGHNTLLFNVARLLITTVFPGSLVDGSRNNQFAPFRAGVNEFQPNFLAGISGFINTSHLNSFQFEIKKHLTTRIYKSNS